MLHGCEIMNYSLSLLCFFVLLTFLHSGFGTVHPSLPPCPPPLPFSSSQCGVSGWVLQCCRLICKYTQLQPNTHTCSSATSPTLQFLLLLFFSASDSLHVVSGHARHRAARIEAHQATVCQQCMACQQT